MIGKHRLVPAFTEYVCVVHHHRRRRHHHYRHQYYIIIIISSIAHPHQKDKVR